MNWVLAHHVVKGDSVRLLINADDILSVNELPKSEPLARCSLSLRPPECVVPVQVSETFEQVVSQLPGYGVGCGRRSPELYSFPKTPDLDMERAP